MEVWRKEDYEKRYPAEEFRYVRHRETGLFYNFIRHSWETEKSLATPVSPHTVVLIRQGKGILASHPVSDLDFIA